MGEPHRLKSKKSKFIVQNATSKAFVILKIRQLKPRILVITCRLKVCFPVSTNTGDIPVQQLINQLFPKGF
jgi:hypothetical protein